MNEHDDDTPAPPTDASGVHSVEARRGIRSRLAADVDAFLARGGNIEEVPQDYRADPPKRPETSYGRGSL